MCVVVLAVLLDRVSAESHAAALLEAFEDPTLASYVPVAVDVLCSLPSHSRPRGDDPFCVKIPSCPVFEDCAHFVLNDLSAFPLPACTRS